MPTKTCCILSSTLVAIITCCLAIPIAAQTRSPDVLTFPQQDHTLRIAVPGSKHALAEPEYDVGPIDSALPMQRLILVLGPTSEQESALRTLLDNQQKIGSPEYHHWLTPEEFGTRFGPSAQDLEKVSNWLQQQGFIIGNVARSGRWMEFSGTAKQVQDAFLTEIHQYQIAGKTHIANSTEISVPAGLFPLVRGVLSLHDFFKKPMFRQYGYIPVAAVKTGTGSTPQANINQNGTTVHALTPGDFAKIYDLNRLYSIPADGTGQTIAIAARAATDHSVADFRAAMGLPALLWTQTFNLSPNSPAPGFTPKFPDINDAIEANLDTEWAGGVAPGANLNVVITASTATTDGVDLSSAYIVDNNIAPIMSVSFAGCEQTLGAAESAFWNGLWQQAAAQGISAIVAAGDSGAAGCDDPTEPKNVPASGGLGVSALASTPFNTAIGGTQFNENGQDSTFWNSSAGEVTANGYIPETVWNESCNPNTSTCTSNRFSLLAGGGGACTLYPKPAWQSLSLPGMPNDGHRDVPDVSLAAGVGHDPYVMCDESHFVTCQFGGTSTNPNFLLVGGTSVSTAAFAGIMAIVDQQMGGRQGLANYVLYQIAGKEVFSNCSSTARTNPAVQSSCVFNDITSGNNTVPGLTGFSAGTGFDLASGLGSVNAFELVNAWKAITLKSTTTTLSPASVSAVHGQPLSITVNVTGSTSPSPSGNVALVSSTACTGQCPAVPVALTPSQSSGTATFSGNVSSLPGGTYTLTAHYPGDGNFGPSDSAPINVSITKENTNVTVSSFSKSPTNIIGTPVPATTFPYGGFLVLDGKVAAASGNGVPSGLMVFADAFTGWGGAQVNQQGVAESEVFPESWPDEPSIVGTTHTITGNYAGDNSFNPSNGQIAITITKGNPVLTVFHNGGGTANGGLLADEPEEIEVQFSLIGLIPPTGTLQFFDGNAPIGTPVTLPVNGEDLTFTTQGQHTVTATYSGDAIYNPATSAPVTFNVVAPFYWLNQSGNNIAASAGNAATFLLQLGVHGSFNGPVTFSCAPSPFITGCSFSPPSVIPQSPPTNVTATVNTSANARLDPPRFRQLPFIFAFAFAGLLGLGRKKKHLRLLALAVFLVAGVGACGGGGGGGGSKAPINTTVVVTATSGNLTSSITLNLTITH